jgi:putative peptide zinc metalloprotease protein
MRFDGYYILSDFLEVPNLQQRSMGMLKFLMQRHVYRMRDATPPTSSAAEAIILIIYGVAAGIYRVVLFVSITLYLVGKMFALGVFLACWTAAMWFILPVGQFIHWLSTSSGIANNRMRAVATSLGLIAAAVVLVGAIPMPDHRRAVGVIESARQSGVYFGADAFVKQVHVRPGQRVMAGDPIVTCESDQLDAQLAMFSAQLDEAMARERDARMQNEAAAQVASKFVETLGEQITYLRGKHDRLVVRAPQEGILVGRDLDSFIGKYVKEGQPLCEIVELDQLRAVATLTQQEAWIYELNPSEFSVEVRRASDLATVIPAKFERSSQSGDRELPHPALGFAGGGSFETESRDQTGMVAKSPLLKAYFKSSLDGDAGQMSRFATAGGVPGQPGERVYLRFTLPRKPLMAQWIDEFQKKLQGRARL